MKENRHPFHPIAIGSGLGTKVCAPCNPKNEKLFCHLAPVAAVPCSNEVRGSEAYKRKTGRNVVYYTGLALHKKSILDLGNDDLSLGKAYATVLGLLRYRFGVSPTEIQYILRVIFTIRK
ncbi:hypothetical protein QFZ20_004895 [Flavobacterium sp. W4I14]|nr:hypothetical protein [Flavobacterium sp. W4I14]